MHKRVDIPKSIVNGMDTHLVILRWENLEGAELVILFKKETLPANMKAWGNEQT